MANKKYGRIFDADLEVKTFRWPYWLLPLLFVSLLLVLGLFIFITIHSTDSFGCFFYCEQKIDDGGVVPPDLDHLVAENTTETPIKHTREEDKMTEKSPIALSQQKKGSPKKKAQVQMKVFGEISLPKDRTFKPVKGDSFMKVTFEDVSIMDASSVVLGSTEFKVDQLYQKVQKGHRIKYEITCTKPPLHGMYSVSAVLNVGWKETEDEWIRKGDYHTDTMIYVTIKKNMTSYHSDIALVKVQ